MEKFGITNLYHGSEEKFDAFSLKDLGKNGTGEGYGIYLTPDKTFAKKYTGTSGYIYNIEVDLHRPASFNRVTITKAVLKKIFKELHEENEFLDNYGEMLMASYYSVLNDALKETLEYNDNDVDIICDVANSCGDIGLTLELFNKHAKFTHAHFQEGEKEVYVVFCPEDIKIKEIESV